MNAQRWSLLLIDDDEEDYILTHSMLEQARGRKISLQWASTYEAGRQKMQSVDYDAVLVDYDLGVQTGIQLIQEFSKSHYPAPMILYTGRGSAEIDVEAMQAGATLYLAKSDATPLLLERSVQYAIERKQALEKLRESEERFRSVLENSLDVAYRRNLQTDRYDYMSPVVERILGFSVREMENLPVDEVLQRIHPDDLPTIEGELASASETGRGKLVYRFRCKDGDYRWLADYVTVQADAAGRPLYLSGILRDITELKLNEQALRESERLFRAALEEVPGVFIIYDPERRIRFINNAAEHLTGRPVSDFIGKRDEEAWPEEITRKYIPQLLKAFDTCQKQRFEMTQTLAEGRSYTYLVTFIPILGERGELRQMLGITHDITERKEFENTMHRSQHILSQAEQMAHLGAWEIPIEDNLNLNNNPLFWSDEVYRIFGYHPGEVKVTNELFFAHVYPEDRPLVSQAVSQAITEHKPYSLEHRIQRMDGVIRTVLEHAVIFFDNMGQPERIIGAVQDITDRKRTEKALKEYTEQLQRSNQALQDFAFIASHDLQEPLRKIRAFGEILQAKYGQEIGEKGQFFLGRMRQASERMTSMIEGLLEYSRVTTQGQPFIEVDLHQIVQEVLSDLEARLMQTKGRVELGQLPVIEADPLQMRQLFQNLISNGLKYHRPDVPPVVKVYLVGTRDQGLVTGDQPLLVPGQQYLVTILVEDNGIGIDVQPPDVIFQPFKRLHGRSEYEGTGMGLPICQKIIERHAGSISFHSTPGEGTVFKVSLPVRQNPHGVGSTFNGSR